MSNSNNRKNGEKNRFSIQILIFSHTNFTLEYQWVNVDQFCSYLAQRLKTAQGTVSSLWSEVLREKSIFCAPYYTVLEGIGGDFWLITQWQKCWEPAQLLKVIGICGNLGEGMGWGNSIGPMEYGEIGNVDFSVVSLCSCCYSCDILPYFSTRASKESKF